jgi:2'-5' RNA ligase
MKIRAFLAVESSSELRARTTILIRELASCPAAVKWVQPENLHLTLKFFGDVKERDVAEISSAAAQAVATLPSFNIECDRLGAFPNDGRPRTVWIGVRRGEEEMVALHDAIDNTLAKLGFARERRRFHPHITVGRVRGGTGLEQLGELIRQRAEYPLASLHVSEVVLMSSELRPAGPVYTALGRSRLMIS